MVAAAATMQEGRATSPAMDAKFIEENQIIEKYLSGRLPLKGQFDFERYCLEHPELLDELKIAERLNRGMRLLEAGGRADALDPKEKPWKTMPVLAGAAALIFALVIALIVLGSKYASERSTVTDLQHRLVTGPLKPPTEARSILIHPDRVKSERALLSIYGGERPQLIEMRVDLSFALQNAFRVTIDKKDQARVGTIDRVLKDSNGQLKFNFNTSGVTPGLYRMQIEGITLRGETIPVAWLNVKVDAP
jgi:hypothetical protein